MHTQKGEEWAKPQAKESLRQPVHVCISLPEEKKNPSLPSDSNKVPMVAMQHSLWLGGLGKREKKGTHTHTHTHTSIPYKEISASNPEAKPLKDRREETRRKTRGGGPCIQHTTKDVPREGVALEILNFTANQPAPRWARGQRKRKKKTRIQGWHRSPPRLLCLPHV